MTKRKRANPRLRRAWNKRAKYQPSFTNMKEYTSFQVTGGVNAQELTRGEPVVFHDSLLMLKRLGGFYQGIDKWHVVKMPFLHEKDKMYFTGDMYVFFREGEGGTVYRTGIYYDKAKAIRIYQQGRCHWFIPRREEGTEYKDPISGLKPNPLPPRGLKEGKCEFCGANPGEDCQSSKGECMASLTSKEE